MNESHPSGDSFPSDTSHGFSYAASGAGQYEQAAPGVYAQQGQPAAYDGYSTGGYSTGTYADGSDFGYDQDPLFGSMHGADNSGWATGTYDAYSGQGTYDDGTYGAYATGGYDTGEYGTGGYDANGAWAQPGSAHTAENFAGQDAQPGMDQADFGWSGGQWDASQWNGGQWDTNTQWEVPGADAGWDAYGYDHAVQGQDGAAAYGGPDSVEAPQGFDQQIFDQQSYEPYESYDSYDPVPAAADGSQPGIDEHQDRQPYGDEVYGFHDEPDATTAFPAFDEYGFAAPEGYNAAEGFDVPDVHGEHAPDLYGADGAPDLYEADDNPGPRVVAPGEGDPQDLRVANLPGRRRSARPRRSALLTVAVPSVAVMGVAAAAAASVAGNAPPDDTTTQAAADVPAKPANKKLDTQLAGLSADADDFADRASRTQERLDLQARQEAEKKRKAREAARKEALRPKFALPVSQHGLSATYGQAGLNWMSVHTGIDFPVSEGTPVMAATDGTVTTKYDVSFGNMAVVTAPDGTETWYCHLSSTKIRSGQVKAGDTIGYSGTSGNSTGPHLHFEVHPGGGDAIDPLPWLRGKGLDPQ